MPMCEEMTRSALGRNEWFPSFSAPIYCGAAASLRSSGATCSTRLGAWSSGRPLDCASASVGFSRDPMPPRRTTPWSSPVRACSRQLLGARLPAPARASLHRRLVSTVWSVSCRLPHAFWIRSSSSSCSRQGSRSYGLNRTRWLLK